MVMGEPKRSIMEGIENTGDVRLHDHRLRLKQRFDIIRKLGQGTYGKVQLGINKKTGQEVAIKTIKKCKIETEADLVRIRREVQIMSSVRHPNIVHIYEVFENSEKMILVMEYCAGGELYDYLSQQKVLQEDEARRLFRQIATAVYYCHKHKICHRDLKLENVLLDEHGSAKIADFGLSNVFEERRLLSTFCGSPLYASPEIVKGTPYIGPEVDCWSLGVLLYTLVYGAMPFDGSNFKRLVKQISTGDYFEPKSPSSASPLIREMLTVDPNLRADITHICDHPWVNKGSDVSCLELAEILANATPVRLDLLLSLAPPPSIGGDKLLVTDEASAIGPDGSPARSMSVANIDSSAERRILEMVAEGGTDAIKPSPTRTIVSNEQPKRKLENAVSMDSAPSQRKKERIIRSSSGSKQSLIPNDSDVTIIPYVESNGEINSISSDILPYDNESQILIDNQIPNEINHNEDIVSMPPKPASPSISKNMSQLTLEIADDKVPIVKKVSPEKSPVKVIPANKDLKAESKIKDSSIKEKTTGTKPIVVKKKVTSTLKKDDKIKPDSIKDKSPPRKSIEKDITGRVITSDKKAEERKETETQSPIEVSPTKQPERRRSKILDATEKLNNLNIQGNQTTETPLSPPAQPAVKPKKVLIPGVSVGSFKEQFERRASLTSGSIPVASNDLKKVGGKTVQATSNNATSKPAIIKKINSVDSEHVPPIYQNRDTNIKLETIGVEPPIQPKEEPLKPTVDVKKPAIVEVHKVPKVLHKSESLREAPKRDLYNSNMSLEDARRSLQQSMALLSQAKSESAKHIESPDEFQNERQKQLKTAREIISNAIGDDGKKINRICTGAKPPVPYGSGGRSFSGTINLNNLNSLPSSPPTSPPHIKSIRESPARTFRTEVQHRVDDVRNKFLPNSRGGSVERIIPIHFAEEAKKLSNIQPSSSGQLPYQRNNTMPYKLNTLPRANTIERETDSVSTPSTPSIASNNSKAEPIKKSPREFIIPIAVEGKGYVTPRQGSLEPSDIPSKMTPSNIGFASRFPKPRRISSLVSGGESEDEDDLHMHRLRSSRRVRADAEKDSVSSGEEDDDEGFELLTAENLFSTLLDRVRSLTNRLNGEEGTGFPQHHQSLFNNLHSPFFNSPHLPRKHKKHNIIREGPSWRRSTSRDVTSDFDSMFPSHPPFPRGSKKSRKAAGNKSNRKSEKGQTTDSDTERINEGKGVNCSDYVQDQNLDLSDLDLSKIELSEKDVETLSGLTPALSRRLQKQLLEHLPPAAARSLRRTLSMNCPNRVSQHKYTRSLSASKSIKDRPSLVEENIEDSIDGNKNESGRPINDLLLDNRRFSYDDDDSSSVSTLSRPDKDINNSEFTTLKSNHSFNSVDLNYNNVNSAPPKRISSVRSTPDRCILSKYLSPDRNTDMINSNFKVHVDSPYSRDSYNTNGYLHDSESMPRRRLFESPISDSTPRKRISRFLRPDFFDTPREESIYVRDRLDRESETQQVLKEIREKKNRYGGISPTNSFIQKEELPYITLNNPKLNVKHSISPISPLSPSRSRSSTPFYPILDHISEVKSDLIIKESEKCIEKDIPSLQTCKQSTVGCIQEEIHTRAENYLPKNTSDQSKSPSIIDKSSLETCNDKLKDDIIIAEKPNPKESKISRPKSYPTATTIIEKVACNIPVSTLNTNSKSINSANSPDINGNMSQSDNIGDCDISVSFNVSLPTKALKDQKSDEKYPHDLTTTVNKKSPTKKKIIVKKKSASQASAAGNVKGSKEKPKDEKIDGGMTDVDSEKPNGKGNVPKTTSPKKKSVLQSLGQKFEKLRNDSFSKSISQEKDNQNNKSIKCNDLKMDNTNLVSRELREHSVPVVINTEPTTESGLIKRAVTITNLPTMASPETQPNKKSVSRVLGLFKKMESKSKILPPSNEVNVQNNTDKTNVDAPSTSSTALVENKPKRPTSLLLNGIGKRVQACYIGATSDSELIKKDKKISKSASRSPEKSEDNKTQKRGLRLDFSKLPKLNQNIFNRRNSDDSLKATENCTTESVNNVDSDKIATNTIQSNHHPLINDNIVNDFHQDQKEYDLESITNVSTPQTNDWTPDYDSNTYSKSENAYENTPHTDVDNTTPETENIFDRIRRRSFYSRFNEKKSKRKSSLVGPGAKEYIPSTRINPQCENDDSHYSNKHDLSPTSPTKYSFQSPLSYDHSNTNKHLHSVDKCDYISPVSPKVRNSLIHDNYGLSGASGVDRYADNIYSKSPSTSVYSTPRYQKTLSYFDDLESRNIPLEPKPTGTRYGRTLSLLSPGIYATYSPRSHTRNSAILLRDSAIDTDLNTEDVLAKIRNRKKAAMHNSTPDDESPPTLDTKFRSNYLHNSENDTSTN